MQKGWAPCLIHLSEEEPRDLRPWPRCHSQAGTRLELELKTLVCGAGRGAFLSPQTQSPSFKLTGSGPLVLISALPTTFHRVGPFWALTFRMSAEQTYRVNEKDADSPDPEARIFFPPAAHRASPFTCQSFHVCIPQKGRGLGVGSGMASCIFVSVCQGFQRTPFYCPEHTPVPAPLPSPRSHRRRK